RRDRDTGLREVGERLHLAALGRYRDDEPVARKDDRFVEQPGLVQLLGQLRVGGRVDVGPRARLDLGGEHVGARERVAVAAVVLEERRLERRRRRDGEGVARLSAAGATAASATGKDDREQ